ncbi:MAG: hypothetical protein IJB65_05775 [Clostridia bacterium]|nr:hypothetical protein [Clostridia bacterium]
MADKYVKLNDIIDTLENEWGYEGMREDLEKLPTADVVEVVRCEDCMYFEIDVEDELGLCKCGYMAVSYDGELYPRRNDFCSYGERSTDENKTS